LNKSKISCIYLFKGNEMEQLENNINFFESINSFNNNSFVVLGLLALLLICL